MENREQKPLHIRGLPDTPPSLIHTASSKGTDIMLCIAGKEGLRVPVLLTTQGHVVAAAEAVDWNLLWS